ncbi:MAG TPA: beta-propeller fold lactonase family protein [Solirubrobacterales bacterium]
MGAAGVWLLTAVAGGSAQAAEPGTPIQLSPPNACFANLAIGGCTADPFGTFLRPLGVDVAPDGRDVYVANQSRNIGHFRRDPATNALTPAGEFSAAGSFELHRVVVAPNGALALSAGGSTSGDGRIEAFTRNPASGGLTPLGCADEAGAGVCVDADGLGGAEGLALAPSGPGIYVAASYGGPSDEGSVAALALNTSSGAFSQLRCIAAIDAPSGKCSEQSGNEPVLGRAAAAAVSPDGRHVYFGGFAGLVGYNRDPNSGDLVSEADCLKRGAGEPLCPQETRLPIVTDMAFSPDGEFLLASGEAVLTVLDRNPLSGALTVIDCFRRPSSASACPPLEGFQGASGIATSPDGTVVYTTGNPVTDGQLRAFHFDPASGRLTSFACVAFTGTGGCAPGAGLLRAFAVDVSDDGRGLYVGSYEGTGTGDFGALAAFRIEQPLAPPPSPPADTTVTVRLLGKRLPVNRRGFTRLRIRCPAGEQSPPCSGRVTVRTRARVSFGGARSSKRRRVVLAGAGFRIAAGRTQAVRLRLARGKHRLLRRNRRARRVVAIARVSDAAGNRRTVRKGLRATFKSRAKKKRGT